MKNSFSLFLVCTSMLIISCHQSAQKTEAVPKKTDSVLQLNLTATNPSVSMTEEGLNTDYYNNGKEKMKGLIKDGQREGLWQAWYENGNLWSEAEYVKGINHGKSVTYFENGKVRYEGKYSNGKKIGNWNYFDENGKLVKTIPN